MTEDKRISRVMEYYTKFFSDTLYDVVKTYKGYYFFCQYDESGCEIDYSIKFNTADELENLILDSMADDFNNVINIMIEDIYLDITKQDNLNDNALTRFSKSLEIILDEYCRWKERADKILSVIKYLYKN